MTYPVVVPTQGAGASFDGPGYSGYYKVNREVSGSG